MFKSLPASPPLKRKEEKKKKSKKRKRKIETGYALSKTVRNKTILPSHMFFQSHKQAMSQLYFNVHYKISVHPL